MLVIRSLAVSGSRAQVRARSPYLTLFRSGHFYLASAADHYSMEFRRACWPRWSAWAATGNSKTSGCARVTRILVYARVQRFHFAFCRFPAGAQKYYPRYGTALCSPSARATIARSRPVCTSSVETVSVSHVNLSVRERVIVSHFRATAVAAGRNLRFLVGAEASHFAPRV
jgi:hypothetical protein